MDVLDKISLDRSLNFKNNQLIMINFRGKNPHYADISSYGLKEQGNCQIKLCRT